LTSAVAKLGTLASYALVAVVVTYPLIWHIRTAFPGSGTDVYGFIWNNWWIHHALTELHTLPYFTDAIFAPFPADLRLHTLGLLYGLISIPFLSALTPVGVLNVQILMTIVLNGYAAFRLTTYVTKSAAAGFVSGLILAATPAINFHLSVGRPSCAAVWPAIFAITALLRLMDRPDWRSSLWLAVWLVATLMVDQQVALFCACWMVVLAGARSAAWFSRPRLAGLLGWGAAAAAVVAIPAYALYSSLLAGQAGYTVPSVDEALKYSYPVRLLWTPRMIWNVYGTVMPLGLLTALAAIGAAKATPYVLGSLIFLAFSLGPVAMGTDVPLPFALVQWLPGLDQFRTPYRFQIPAAIGLAVLAGIIVSRGLSHLGPPRGRWLLGGIVMLTTADLVVNRAVGGFKIQTTPHEAIYEQIARDERDCLVLEIPFGVRTGTDRIGSGETLTIFQPVHRKRLMNGFLARAPLAPLEYYRASPAIMFLAHEAPLTAEVAEDLPQKIRELAVGYIVMHPEMMDTAWLKEALALLQGLEGVRRLETDGGVIAFKVERRAR
jgi:hypothetical protein